MNELRCWLVYIHTYMYCRVWAGKKRQTFSCPIICLLLDCIFRFPYSEHVEVRNNANRLAIFPRIRPFKNCTIYVWCIWWLHSAAQQQPSAIASWELRIPSREKLVINLRIKPTSSIKMCPVLHFYGQGLLLVVLLLFSPLLIRHHQIRKHLPN